MKYCGSEHLLEHFTHGVIIRQSSDPQNKVQSKVGLEGDGGCGKNQSRFLQTEFAQKVISATGKILDSHTTLLLKS